MWPIIFLCKFSEDKTDLENSVMQKKIKIPKLSLNHLEEIGEIADYGDEDVELRHCKVLKSFLFVFSWKCLTVQQVLILEFQICCQMKTWEEFGNGGRENMIVSPALL